MITAVSTVIDAPAERLWALLDDFGNWHRWLPRMVSTTMDGGLDQAPVGSVRILTREDGTTIRERLLRKDANSLSYDFDGPQPFPVRRYVGTVRVEAVTSSGAAFIHWSADFDADAAEEARLADLFRGIYLSFFAALSEAVRLVSA